MRDELGIPVEDEESPGSERRIATRVDVEWSVDCETPDTFLYASIRNISQMGIFVMTGHPLEVGTELTLKFAPPGHEAPLELAGVVQWVNLTRPFAPSPNPGMGIRFVGLTLDQRERIVEIIRTIAYVRDTPTN